ncbi:hypothetical protein GCM10028803_05330 [Larkinella knui]|uniref:Uncharacterized protein n=1 Tax=Larkinella knui TaxID=2025310 RepID=A0A3P1CKK3_9BACT|nr:hypothetical protein [Larkinella knui]RRB13789.1 hypothetical protein EHT87_16150 [Larkinella knui]
MFDIRIEGYSVDLNPASQITLEKYNPILDFATVQGARVNTFTLPDTPLNRRVLGYFYDPQAGYTNRRYFCEKYVDSQVIESGYVKIQESAEAGTTLFFTQNLGEIFGDLQGLALSEIPFASLALPGAPMAAANHLADAYCFPSIENPGFYGNQAFTGVMNSYNSGTSSYAAEARVPHFFLRWVLAQFGLKTGWRFQGVFLDDPDLARLILANLYSLDGASAIFPANHLPDLTGGGLLIELRKLFNLYLDFDVRRKVADIGFVDDILAAPCLLDWTSKADPGHTKTPETVNRLELGYELDSNDALMKPIPPSMDKYITPETVANEGGSVLPIRSRLSTYLKNPVSGLAMTSQPGISPNNKDSQNKGNPKILFWNGIVSGKPRATHTCGTRSLIWNGSNNLVNAGYGRFEAFKESTFRVNKVVNLTPADLATFSFRNKVHIKGVNYLVGSMKVALMKDQKVIPAELELWRV